MILLIKDYFADLQGADAESIVCKKKLVEHDKFQLKKCSDLEVC